MTSAATIYTALLSQISTTLGATWSQLDYAYNLEKNSLRDQSKAYGVVIGSNNTVTGTTQAVTYDQSFGVILGMKYTNRKSESSQVSAISTLLQAKESLDIQIFQKKLNTSGVLVVQEIGMDEPIVDNDNIVYLRFNYIVKFRNQTI